MQVLLKPIDLERLNLVLSILGPQPHLEHVPTLMEPEQAQRDLQLRIIQFYAPARFHCVYLHGDPTYETIWKDSAGRPYIRIWNNFMGISIDVFVLSPEA